MVRIGRIINELEHSQHGQSKPIKVNLIFNHSVHPEQAYAKKLNAFDCLVEIVAALIGIDLGLPIAEPVLAFSLTGDDIWFASIDMRYPDLLHSLDIRNNQIENTPQSLGVLKRLAEWRLVHEAIVFDEWIANGDRNMGNILYDGHNDFVLIDHNQAMRTPFYPAMPINNQLLKVKSLFTSDELSKQRLKAKLEHYILQIDPNITDRLFNELVTESDEQLLSNMVEFLKKRLICLTGITLQKITTRQLSL